MNIKAEAKNLLKKILVAYVFILSSVAYGANSSLVDNDTNLEWHLESKEYEVWEDALHYCSSLDTDGGGWRLPNLQELLSLMDFQGGYTENSSQQRVRSYAKASFRDSTSTDSAYWSSTINKYTTDRSTNSIQCVGYGLGDVFSLSIERQYFSVDTTPTPKARCVRDNIESEG